MQESNISNVPYRLINYDHIVHLDRFFERDIEALFDEDGDIYRPYDPEANVYNFTITEVPINELEDGKIYINIDGHSIKYTPNEKLQYEFITRSPLYLWKKETVDKLTPLQLRLFWILTYNTELENGL